MLLCEGLFHRDLQSSGWLKCFFSLPMGTFRKKSLNRYKQLLSKAGLPETCTKRDRSRVKPGILNKYTKIFLELMLRPGIQASPGLVAVLLTSLGAAMCIGILQQTILLWCPTASSWLLQTASTVSLSHIGGACWPMDILLLLKSLQFSCSSQMGLCDVAIQAWGCWKP